MRQLLKMPQPYRMLVLLQHLSCFFIFYFTFIRFIFNSLTNNITITFCNFRSEFFLPALLNPINTNTIQVKCLSKTRLHFPDGLQPHLISSRKRFPRITGSNDATTPASIISPVCASLLTNFLPSQNSFSRMASKRQIHSSIYRLPLNSCLVCELAAVFGNKTVMPEDRRTEWPSVLKGFYVNSHIHPHDSTVEYRFYFYPVYQTANRHTLTFCRIIRHSLLSVHPDHTLRI